MSSSSTIRNTRSDGEESRQRLLLAALRLFAEKGFAKTSTRVLAQTAGTNLAAIRYYFGDKAGLYRAAFTESVGSPQDDIALFSGIELSLHDALAGLYSGFTEPLKVGELARQCTRLHMREMVEPTGLWEHEIDHGIVPHHAALVKVLCRHLRVTRADDDIHRLAQSLVALGVYLFVGRDVMEKIAPQLTATPRAVNTMHQRLVQYALAMVQAEGQRRVGAKHPAQQKSRQSVTTSRRSQTKA